MLAKSLGKFHLAWMSDPLDPAHAQQRSHDVRRIVEHTTAELEARLAAPLAAGLHLVATPIGNLGDVTLRALAVLTNADRLYCEDTRQSHKLLGRYGIRRRIDTYHEHNAERERPRILEALGQGLSVALISDAGTPLVSDPGFKLVRAVVEAGHRVEAVPGASAPLAALVASGLPTDAFMFAGFLPPREVARRERIGELACEAATLILFEAPSRLADTLADLASILGPRSAVVARELTKLNEHHHRGTLAELAKWAEAAPVKGEIVIVIAASEDIPVTDSAICAALEAELATASVRDAAQAVATRLGVSKKRVYDLALAAKGQLRSNPSDTPPKAVDDPC